MSFFFFSLSLPAPSPDSTCDYRAAIPPQRTCALISVRYSPYITSRRAGSSHKVSQRRQKTGEYYPVRRLLSPSPSSVLLLLLLCAPSTCSNVRSDKWRSAFSENQLVRQKEDSVRLYEKEERKGPKGVTSLGPLSSFLNPPLEPRRVKKDDLKRQCTHRPFTHDCMQHTSAMHHVLDFFWLEFMMFACTTQNHTSNTKQVLNIYYHFQKGMLT